MCCKDKGKAGFRIFVAKNDRTFEVYTMKMLFNSLYASITAWHLEDMHVTSFYAYSSGNIFPFTMKDALELLYLVYLMSFLANVLSECSVFLFLKSRMRSWLCVIWSVYDRYWVISRSIHSILHSSSAY